MPNTINPNTKFEFNGQTHLPRFISFNNNNDDEKMNLIMIY